MLTRSREPAASVRPAIRHRKCSSFCAVTKGKKMTTGWTSRHLMGPLYPRRLPAHLRHVMEFRDASWYNIEGRVILAAVRRALRRAAAGGGGERAEEYRRRGLSVWAYFNNDGGGHALTDAVTLRGLVGG
jgi:hypothetical protein